jgi:hypothetical protein
LQITKKMLHKKGHVVWINLTLSFLKLEKGEEASFVGVFTDHWCLGQGIASTIFRGTSNLEQTDINVCQL